MGTTEERKREMNADCLKCPPLTGTVSHALANGLFFIGIIKAVAKKI